MEIGNNSDMERLLKRLSQIGIDASTIEALNAEDIEKARETALLLIVMFDDRHEYVE